MLAHPSIPNAFYFSDLFVQETPAQKGSRDAFLFFHGFPGGGVRNEDLADAVARQSGMTTFVIHFGGLGHGKGEFGFLKSIEQSLAFVEEVAASERFDRLHLFGHSFGGLVALNAARKISESSTSKLGDIFLVSPFSFVPSANETRALLASMRNSDADFPAALDIETTTAEVELIGKRFNPREIAPQLKARRVFILQAKHDDEVPAQLNRLFAPMFQPEARYLEVDQDHSFTDRPALIKIVSDWLR